MQVNQTKNKKKKDVSQGDFGYDNTNLTDNMKISLKSKG